jgi:hypothetical protein
MDASNPNLQFPELACRSPVPASRIMMFINFWERFCARNSSVSLDGFLYLFKRYQLVPCPTNHAVMVRAGEVWH